MTDSSPKLSLFETCGIAIAGMVGGGIFAVMGEAVVTAGSATFISLGLGGILALITGVAYSKLTVEYNEISGSFNFIEHILGIQAAGAISWILLAGYACTVGLYAFAFGCYANRLLGHGIGPDPWLAGTVLIAVVALLLIRSYKPTPRTTDLFIYLKILIVGGLIVIGFFSVRPSHIKTITNVDGHHIWLAAALIFVIYEGFQILTYRYDIIQNHRKNLPRAIWISVSIVVLIYMMIAFVLTGSLGPHIIARNQVTAIALLAQPLFGQTGIDIVLAGGLISTAAAIYTTVYATGQLAGRIVADRQLPHQLTQIMWHKTPVIFVILLAAGALTLQYILQLDALIILCSALFLLVFSIVNFVGYLHAIFKGWKKIIPLSASLGCAAGFFILLYHSYRTGGEALYLLLFIILGLLVLRACFSWFHSHYKGREKQPEI